MIEKKDFPALAGKYASGGVELPSLEGLIPEDARILVGSTWPPFTLRPTTRKLQCFVCKGHTSADDRDIAFVGDLAEAVTLCPDCFLALQEGSR